MQNAEAPEPQALGVEPGQAQVPPVQLWPAGQVVPQEPQFCGSVCVVAQ